MSGGPVDLRRLMVEQIELATPAERLVMIWDRLALNLERAGQSMADGDHEAVNTELLSAQQILVILSNTLDQSWPPAAGIDRLYRWAWERLVAANIGFDPSALAAATTVLTELHFAWTAAAATELTAPSTARAS